MLKTLLEKFTTDKVTLTLNKAGTLQSLNPPETRFGFTYHSHCVPPFRPEHTLILGYGKGNIAELMRRVWGQVKVTGVDNLEQAREYNEYSIVTKDAYNFVRECADSKVKTRFDYIVLDLFDLESNEHPDFMFDASFAMRIREICVKMLCINVFTKDVPRLRAYYDYGFKFIRNDNVYGNSVIFWEIKK